MLSHTFTEKDNVLTWTKKKEKKNIYLKWWKNCKKKKKKKKKKQKTENKEIAKQLERKNQKYAGIDIDIGMENVSKMRKDEAKKI